MFSTNLHKSKHFFIFQDNLKIWELPGKVAIKSLFLSHPNFICLHSNKVGFELLYGLFSSVVQICNKRNKPKHYPESSQRSRTLGTGTPAFARAFIILPEQREMSNTAGWIDEIFLKLFFWIKVSTCRN